MLNRPPPHTEEEIQALVDEFGASYQPGVTILTVDSDAIRPGIPI